jgi:hypothetical protein
MSTDRPSWARAIAPAKDPGKTPPALVVKRDHSAGYKGKYAPKPEQTANRNGRR